LWSACDASAADNLHDGRTTGKRHFLLVAKAFTSKRWSAGSA
jgi:hypothetical protein